MTTGYNFSKRAELANTLKPSSKIALIATILSNGETVLFLEK